MSEDPKVGPPRVPSHPCLTCGACCAHFRVSFYWAEPVPEELTEKLTPFRSCMKGTNSPRNPRCIALEGEVGRRVSCSIYENRSSACRAFEASYESGVPHAGCDEARVRHGLKPLTPGDWSDFPLKYD
ncbi:MAG: YkgJ family cysteine cluster protein [Proteobacteria bacterium]|nr:YkgJ family cysteine cluster protein [Pseudomonadota bacterium]